MLRMVDDFSRAIYSRMRPMATGKGQAQSAIRDCNIKDDDKKKTAQLLANHRGRL